MTFNGARRAALARAGAVALAITGMAFAPAWAQSLASRPLRIVVPWAPGGMVDTGGRVIGDALQKALGQPAAVENVPGAAGKIGAAQVAKARPDGATLLFATSSLAIDVAAARPTSFDPLHDLAPVSRVAYAHSVVIVAPDSPLKSLADLVAAAKAAPGSLSYGTPGIGSPAHLFTEMFLRAAGLRLLHVPYGRNPAINDLMGGRLSLMFATIPVALPQIRNGTVRALAVTGARRFPGLPEVPTVAEAGVPGYEAGQWLGLFVPAGTPAEAIARLNAEVGRALNTPAVADALRARGLDPAASSAAAFAQLLAADVAAMREVIRAAGIRFE